MQGSKTFTIRNMLRRILLWLAAAIVLLVVVLGALARSTQSTLADTIERIHTRSLPGFQALAAIDESVTNLSRAVNGLGAPWLAGERAALQDDLRASLEELRLQAGAFDSLDASPAVRATWKEFQPKLDAYAAAVAEAARQLVSGGADHAGGITKDELLALLD